MKKQLQEWKLWVIYSIFVVGILVTLNTIWWI